MKRQMKRVLTIAGSDSGGGAGIQADLKTFAAFGVYGMSVLTAITAQNTVGVQEIFELPAKFVGKQIDSVMEDIGADTWKIGMLANKEIVKIVSNRANKYKVKFVVLDPVMVAKSGDFLLRKEVRSTLIKKLLPLAFLITPNLHEAQVMTGLKINTVGKMRTAAVALYKMGSRNVVVKGGHLPKSAVAVDILYNGRVFSEFSTPRVKTTNTHGTGCTFSSAIAAQLAKGDHLFQAVKIAKNYLTTLLKKSQKLALGKGHGPLNHLFNLSTSLTKDD